MEAARACSRNSKALITCVALESAADNRLSQKLKTKKKAEKLDKINDRIDKVDKHLAVYSNQLEFYIKRTDLIEEELKPLKSSFFKTQGALDFLGI